MFPPSLATPTFPFSPSRGIAMLGVLLDKYPLCSPFLELVCSNSSWCFDKGLHGSAVVPSRWQIHVELIRDFNLQLFKIMAIFGAICNMLFILLGQKSLQNESSPNFSNFRPEFCPEFSLNFSRIIRASFRGKRRPAKIPAIFQCKTPRQTRQKYSQNVSGKQAT